MSQVRDGLMSQVRDGLMSQVRDGLMSQIRSSKHGVRVYGARGERKKEEEKEYFCGKRAGEIIRKKNPNL